MWLPSDWKRRSRSARPARHIMGRRPREGPVRGEAKDLRARVRNYSVPGGRQAGDSEPHQAGREIRCIVTATEKEALLLENTLIKRHRPPFNIFFRDDKEYLLLRIDRNEEFPRPSWSAGRRRDGATYFGPYSSARGIRETVRELLRIFPLCSCSGGNSPHARGRVSTTRWEVPRACAALSRGNGTSPSSTTRCDSSG